MTLEHLPPLDFPGGLNTVAFGINKQGQIVGRYRAQGSPRDHGFLYDQGLFTTLDLPQAESTWATRINDKLQIVGFYGSPSGRHGFLYDHSTFTTIDVPFSGALHTRAFGINNPDRSWEFM